MATVGVLRAAPPAAPTDFTAFAPAGGVPHFIWTDRSEDEDRFEMEYRAVGGVDWQPIWNSQAPNFELARLSGGGGSTFEFRIAAARGSEYSEWVETTFAIPATLYALTGSEDLGGQEGEAVDYQIYFWEYDEVQADYVTSSADSYFAENLPAGLSLNTATGKVTGVFPSAGVHRAFLGAVKNGLALKQVIHFRSSKASSGVVILPDAPPVPLLSPGGSAQVDLKEVYGHRNDGELLRFNTSKGSFLVELFSDTTPKTVANFLGYVRRGDYDGTIIHRSIEDFIIQGGGFFPSLDGMSDWGVVNALPPVPNEPAMANVAGTIAMAKLGNNQDSATSGWFFNTADNPHLDTQNGGFTVFGRVVNSAHSVINSINTLPTGNYSVFLEGEETAYPFEDVPFDLPTTPAALEPSAYVLVNTMEEVPAIASMELTNNDNPDLLTATLSGENILYLEAANRVGLATLTVKLTDILGEMFFYDISIPVADAQNPSIRLTAPKKKRKLPGNKKLAIKGVATDNFDLLRWEFRINNKKWKNGGALAGTSRNFSRKVGKFRLGKNKVRVRAIDRAGRSSVIAQRNVRLR